MFPSLSSKLSSTLARASAFLALAAATTCLSAQTTRNVGPGQPYTTIQSGIDAANPGDTVLVAPGTYYEQLNFNGKGITLVSSGGASTTIIDGSGTGTVVYMYSTSPSQLAILDGFTIQHGYPNGQGDLYNIGGAVDAAGNAIVRNNIIANNTSCGVDVLNGNVTVQNNHIFNNVSASGAGANCRVNGFGIYAHDNTVIRTNINLLNNLIEQNQDGGISMYNLDASTTVNIEQNVIRSNGVLGQGPGVSTGIFALTNVIGNLITGNGGPGIDQYLNNTITVINNTVYLNSLSCVPQYAYQGTEVQLGIVDNAATLSNNMIVGSSNSYPVVSCTSNPFEGQFNWDHNIVYDTVTHTGSIPCFPDPTGINLYVDPHLRNPSGGDYHLAAGSPAIDTGNNSAPLLTTTDLDGNPRIQDATGTPCAIVDIGAYEYPGVITHCITETETLTSSLNPSNFGANVTFTATLNSTSGTPTGTVQFKDGSTVLGVQTVSTTGTSSYSTAALSVGTHPITAVYEPTGLFTATSASLSQVVNGSPTTTALTCNPSTISIGGTSLFSAMVTSPNGTPTGSITFTDNGTTLAQPTLASGNASFTYTGQSRGTHNILATYIPTGSFSASSASCAVTVNGLPTTTTVAVTPNPSTYGQPVIFSAHVAPVAPNKAVPTGTINFLFCRGAEISATLDASGNVSVIQPAPNNSYEIASPVGSCTFTAQYSGDTIFDPSTSATDTYIVTPAPSTTTIISASPNPAYFSQTVSFTVQVKGVPSPTANPVTGLPIPPATTLATGTINLSDGTVLIGSAPVVAGAPGNQAVLTTSTLSIGSHTITASYSGDANLGGSVSSPVTEVITAAPPPNFSLTGTNITIPALHSGTGDLELTSLNSFSGSIAVTCNPPYPVNYTCTLQYPSSTLRAGASSVVAFTLNYSATATVRTKTRIVLATFFPLTLISLLGLARKRRTPLRALLTLSLLTILTTATTACGPDHFIPITTGTYPLTFTATGTSQGTSTPITHTVTINATITP